MFKKTGILILLSFVIICAQSCQLFEYKKRMNEMNEGWYRDSFYLKDISGRLDGIFVMNEDSSRVVLSIYEIHADMTNSYGLTCVNKHFYKIARVNYIIHKPGKSIYMDFCSDSSTCNSYPINFCGQFD